MLEVGRVEPPLPGTFFSWNRAHFGGWCIVSSPLIIGLELTDENLEPVLDILGNVEAIEVNQLWAGHPVRRIDLTLQSIVVFGPNIAELCRRATLTN